MPISVGFHPDAADDATGAEEWYRSRSESASAKFASELERAVELIGEAPERGRATITEHDVSCSDAFRFQ